MALRMHPPPAAMPFSQVSLESAAEAAAATYISVCSHGKNESKDNCSTSGNNNND